MYVLMDIEWVTNRQAHISPTQIAALRVDDAWGEKECFFRRIRPRDASFHLWNEMAFAGSPPSTFLYAPGIYQVLTDLQGWLQDDDMLCFWTEHSINVLKSVFHLVLHDEIPQQFVDLSQYIFPYMKSQRLKCGNAYQIASACGCIVPGPKHCSERDVQVMAMALSAIHYPSDQLLLPPPKPVRKAIPAQPKGNKGPAPDIGFWPYVYDTVHGLFHRRECTDLPDDAVLTGHPDLKYLFRKKLTPCPACMAELYRIGLRERNEDIIQRTEYNFVFSNNSKVFHRRDCKAILSTTGLIQGSVYYKHCSQMGLRPCKLCKPSWEGMYSAPKKIKQEKKTSSPERSLKLAEQRAMTRFIQARDERFARANKEFKSQTEKDDFYTLTQTRFAFWAAAGYATFHRRECRKLKGLSNLRGFSRYKDAIRSGHTPCKYCKPNAKQDIVCPIPINNRKRADECVGDLETLCNEHGYPFQFENGMFLFSTPVGKWKINTMQKPYTVEHINLVTRPGNEFYYHRQPRLFLSLLDTFEYIHRHDKDLAAKTSGLIATSVEQACSE